VIAGLIQRTARQLARRDVLVSLPTTGLRRALIATGAVAGALLFYAIGAPKPVLPSLARAMGADLPVPTRTRIEWVTPTSDQSVVRGTPVSFETRVTGPM